MSSDSEGPHAGVIMVWCDRPRSGHGPSSRNHELKFLASDYHYLCPLDYAHLGVRDLSKGLDPRVVLKRCPKCRTTWYGPSLSELRARPSGSSGPLDVR